MNLSDAHVLGALLIIAIAAGCWITWLTDDTTDPFWDAYFNDQPLPITGRDLYGDIAAILAVELIDEVEVELGRAG